MRKLNRRLDRILRQLFHTMPNRARRNRLCRLHRRTLYAIWRLEDTKASANV